MPMPVEPKLAETSRWSKYPLLALIDLDMPNSCAETESTAQENMVRNAIRVLSITAYYRLVDVNLLAIDDVEAGLQASK